MDFDADAELIPIREHLRTAPQRDYMASRGEYLNSRLLASWLDWPIVDAASCVRFAPDGSFDGEITQELLSKALRGLDIRQHWLSKTNALQILDSLL